MMPTRMSLMRLLQVVAFMTHFVRRSRQKQPLMKTATRMLVLVERRAVTMSPQLP